MSKSIVDNLITKSVTVHCNLATAFRIWTEQIDLWWPKSHSISGNANTEVIFETKVYGRFFERLPDGTEHDFGRVLVYEPPYRLIYHWYIGSSQQEPTRVEIRFSETNHNQTRIDIEHRGPEYIGDLWPTRAARFNIGWDVVLRNFASSICE